MSSEVSGCWGWIFSALWTDFKGRKVPVKLRLTPHVRFPCTARLNAFLKASLYLGRGRRSSIRHASCAFHVFNSSFMPKMRATLVNADLKAPIQTRTAQTGHRRAKCGLLNPTAADLHRRWLAFESHALNLGGI